VQLGNGVAQGEHEPVGVGVQHEGNLIGDGRTTGRLVV
jgi:hypothetical protein